MHLWSFTKLFISGKYCTWWWPVVEHSVAKATLCTLSLMCELCMSSLSLAFCPFWAFEKSSYLFTSHFWWISHTMGPHFWIVELPQMIVHFGTGPSTFLDNHHAAWHCQSFLVNSHTWQGPVCEQNFCQGGQLHNSVNKYWPLCRSGP